MLNELSINRNYWIPSWLSLFFLTALLTPPLPVTLGDSGPHLAVAWVALGAFLGLIHITSWRASQSWLPIMLIAFMAVLFESVAFAALYSGMTVALGSLARVLLFSISAYVFFYALMGPGSVEIHSYRFTRFLFWIAVAAALFACFDFYFQFPAPAGYGPQFVWLDEGVFRRAQGLFYEASTLGNFCAFFLVMILVSLFQWRLPRPCRVWELVTGGVILATALVLSYSRASLVNIGVAMFVLVCLRGSSIRRAALRLIGSAAVGVLILRLAFPSFAEHYWWRLSNSAKYMWSSPEGVLSGRLRSWTVLTDFLAQEPWHAVFGIGYKTLPYSDYTGTTVIADNTYLSLLVETGIIGLFIFLALNVAILSASLRAARSHRPRAMFFGTWMLCFWSGQMVQMLSGDLITYWRVLPVYFWTLATTIRESEGSG